MIFVLLDAEFTPRGQSHGMTAVKDTFSKYTILTMLTQSSSVSVLSTAKDHKDSRILGCYDVSDGTQS
jgi:hypothetical protein